MFTAFKRVIKAGYQSFKRNGWLSTATIMVITLSLFVLGNLIFISAFANSILADLQTKIDVSVYFATDAAEPDILSVKKDIENHPDVTEVSYVSRDEALKIFRDRNKDDILIEGALQELGENPLEASINIRARDPSRYAAISEFLTQKNYPIVNKINYFENQLVIERLGAILTSVRGAGTILVAVLALIAVLVSFNTIRMAIYTLREEIGIMRLVGSSRWFIRGPFLISGILYGLVATILTLMIFFPLIWLISPKIFLFSPNFDLFQYFLANIVEFSGILLVTGTAIGSISSVIAIRRYLDA